MKKILIVFGFAIAGFSTQAQTSKIVVFIPKTNICYEASDISTSSNGKTTTLKIGNAISVEPTPERLAVANDCQKGEFQNDDSHGGTHNVTCDETVNATCFCTGVK